VKRLALVTAAAALLAPPALGAEDLSDDVREAVLAALSDRAEPFATPPSLPDAATARAKDVSFGQQGARKKLDAAERAHGAAAEEGRDAARADAANRSAQGAAASAARAANADNHAAAGQARADKVKKEKNPPPGRGR
jgi:hypothetical protein